ncbi:hypothetical protein [Aneurinibacillus uraniidurans]|uniref:hypothetical protein n=1 Tax=Aneurinibacillus uraniidurans TaxID=2966586 RepID=UPI00234B3CC5|nr:hypothetical protein [Aneurinibacillus sp. B1]WCN36883.1 hypothetical protein PO771_13565 [Aneurinibacillus sp. B1]
MKGTAQQVQKTSTANTNSMVTCRKCKSTQVVANKRGYNFLNMFLGLVIMVIGSLACTALSSYFWRFNTNFSGGMAIISFLLFILTIPVAILSGFIGRSKLVNGCMNCGHKWMP